MEDIVPDTESNTEEAKSADEVLKAGYLVGLTKDGELVFQLLGDFSNNLVELLGVQRFADIKVNEEIDKIRQKDPINQQIASVLLQMATHLARIENLVKSKESDK